MSDERSGPGRSARPTHLAAERSRAAAEREGRNAPVTRRMVLKGIGGAVLALPVLESFAPRHARAQQQSSDLSFAVFFRQANGVACQQMSPLGTADEPERFWPTAEGPLTPETLTGRALDELLDHSSRLLVVGNVNMQDYNYGDGHARGALQGLTARGPTVEAAGGDSEAAGESLDHRIGVELNAQGRDSLFLYAGQSGGWLGGPCISYRGAAVRRAAFQNPKGAYDAVAGVGGGLSAEALQQLSTRKKSIHDLVRAQLTRLLAHPRLSMADRDRLDLHLTNVRELETSLGCELDSATQQLLDGAEAFYDSSDGNDVWATTRLHMEIAAMAIACGHTRSVALQVGNGNDGSGRYPDPDTGALMENFHYISHRRLSHDDTGAVIPGSDLLHHKVDRQFGQAFKYLLDRLLAYTMPDGKSLLDHGVAVWYNDLANGPAHGPWGVPFVLAGSVDGTFKQGQYVSLAGGRTANHSQLLNTLGAAVGVRNGSGAPLDDFGDPSLPTGQRSELLA